MSDQPLERKLDAEAVSQDDRLDSWKEIANFLNKDPRTAQRWERERGLPVHRYPGDKSGGVFAYKSEIEAWWLTDIGAQTFNEPAVSTEAENRRELLDETEEYELERPTYDGNDEERRRRKLKKVAAWAVLAALVIVGVLWWRLFSVHPQKVRLMVRNLQNLSSRGADDAFSQGMTEQIITDLGAANPEQLGVLARTTANLYSKKTIPELRAQGMDYALLSRIYGPILALGVVQACDRVPSPWHRRCEIRRIVWSPLVFCC